MYKCIENFYIKIIIFLIILKFYDISIDIKIFCYYLCIMVLFFLLLLRICDCWLMNKKKKIKFIVYICICIIRNEKSKI